jgi:hypothetical protein
MARFDGVIRIFSKLAKKAGLEPVKILQCAIGLIKQPVAGND